MSDGNTKEEPYTFQQVCEKAEDDMIKALNSYGSKEVLDLLLIYSHGDSALQWLLGRYPTVVSMSQFFYEKPLIESREKSENILNTNFPALISEKDEREEDRKTLPANPKRKKTSKRKKKPESDSWLNQYLS